MDIAHLVRQFITSSPLLDQSSTTPQIDPRRFQNLDKLVTRAKWLPAVQKCFAVHSAGFPSDHYALYASLKVKLGARPPPKVKPQKYYYDKSSETKSRFNHLLRDILQETPIIPTSTNTSSAQVYTDGSGTTGYCSAVTSAGWGFVILFPDEPLIEACGPVTTDCSASDYLGARVGSNNTGELSAWIESALFLLEVPSPPSTITFYYDSKWTHGMVTGKFRPKRHREMVALSKHLLAKLSSKSTIRWVWIKGHSGDPLNDAADSLADKGKTTQKRMGGRSSFQLPDSDSPNHSHSSTNPQELYTSFVSALKQAEKSSFSPLSISPKQPWISQETLQLLHSARQLKILEHPGFKEASKRAKSSARRDKKAWLHRSLHSDADAPTSSVWKTVSRLRRGFSHRRSRLVYKGRLIPFSQTHEAFADHLTHTQWGPSDVHPDTLQELHESEDIFPVDNAPPPKFSLHELSAVLTKLRTGRAPGLDGIRAELLLALDFYGESWLLRLMNACWESETTPKEWSDAYVVTIYKGKGDSSNPACYRPISLLNTLYKVYASLLQQRLSTQYDDRLRNTQYGFRSNRGTDDPLFILRRAQDYSAKTGTPFHLLFLDWKQAFDSIDHSAMLTALRRTGMHPKYLRVIQELYTEPRFCTKGHTGEEAWGRAHTGIRQGCPLSPYLFVIVLSVVFHDVDTRLRAFGVPSNTWSVGKPAYDLEYADDTLLFALSQKQLQEFLHYVQLEASMYGLELNYDKTELLSHPTHPIDLCFTDTSPVKKVNVAKYLGSYISWEAPVHTAINHRKNLMHSAHMKLQAVWRSKLSVKARARVFNACILPVLLYGLSNLPLEKHHYRSLDGFYFRFLRRAIGMKSSYYSRISNRKVWLAANSPTLPSQILIHQQLKRFASVVSTPPEDPRHHVVFGPAYKDRIKNTKSKHRGNPRPYWLSVVHKHSLPILEDFLHTIPKDHPYQRRDPLGITQALKHHPKFKRHLETAPTRKASLFPSLRATVGSAWRP